MLKNSMLTLAAAAGLISALPVNAMEVPQDGNDVLDAVIMWLPNLGVNIMDTFTFEAGAGATVKLGAKVTRLCDIGFGYCEQKPTFVWGPNRQFGGCVETGREWTAFVYSQENMKRELTTRTVRRYEYLCNGIPLPTEPVYNFFVGQRNYWAIGVYGGAGIDGEFDVNPDEIGDLAAGLFFFDLKGDWLTTSVFTGKALGNQDL